MKVEEAKKIIKRAREKNRIPHTYIIYGGDEKEREEVATFFSLSLICKKENFPCFECETCKKITNKTHPDIRWVLTEKKILSINQVRWLKEDIYITPYSGERKIYIFKINYMKDEAANSFLKILEEPPSYGIILILSENINFFLPTIISRCQKIPLNYKLPSYDETIEKTEKEFLEIVKLKKNNLYEFFKYIDKFVKEREREEIEMWIEKFLWFYRDLCFKKGNFPENLLVNNRIDVKIYNGVNFEKMEKIIEFKNRIKYNVNLKLTFEVLLLTVL